MSKDNYKNLVSTPFKSASHLSTFAVCLILFASSPNFTKTVLTRRIFPSQKPKDLIIITPGVDNASELAGLKLLYPGASCLNKELTTAKSIIGAIEAEARAEKNTLGEVYISGHGNDNGLYPVTTGPNSGNFIHPKHFLGLLLSRQQDNNNGRPFANTIVFGWCYGFSNLSHADIEEYRRYAKELKINIVGAVSLATFAFGKNICFHSDGSIDKHKSSSLFCPLTHLAQFDSWINGYTGSWYREFKKEQRGHPPNRSKESLPILAGPHP